MRRRLFVAGLLATFCIAGHAACDTGLAERMHAKLHPQRQLDHERAVCEPWRGLPGRFIVVLPLPRPSSRPDANEFDLDVLVVQQADNGNTDRAKIVSRLFEEAALTEDAVRISAIKVDTARYVLAPDARAFGLRILHQGSSRDHPYSNETLTLYLPQGQRLVKVLDKFETVMELGAWDTSCEGNFETVHSSLALARSTSNGLADLNVRETRSESRSILQGEECVTQDRPAKFKSTMLRYNGKSYRASGNVAAD
ncbi:hypothetical protein SRS16CHR_02390 [Variovorax sp. SRS16]|uniref:hypothetical protein n=1 Tax=Variovorax sp. SRS16 TaxID=282217 RepID=UPI0013197E7A|nr:hypothetical protein [Variovorax sp. SRS16]VTU19206.1 hypothetical protein SRS16CHR_02390 [Variovorax sp. SRS16]